MSKFESDRALLRAFAQAARDIEAAKREGGRLKAWSVAAKGRMSAVSFFLGMRPSRRKLQYADALGASFACAFGR